MSFLPLTIMKTHPHFKSYVPGVTNADEIRDRIGNALGYQYMFERKSSPWEMSRWDPSELRHFEIDLDRIDRLYHIESYDDHAGDRRYFMLARMEYKDTRVFVEFSAGCDYTGFDECQGGGEINLVLNPNLFGKVKTWSFYDMEKLNQYWAEDGYAPPLHDIPEAMEDDYLLKPHDIPDNYAIC